MYKLLPPTFRRDENRRVVIEWISTSWRPLPAGIITTYGFVVCLLPSTMVVLSKNVKSLQVGQCLVQWYGVTPDGGRHDCRSPFGQLVACSAAVGTVVKGWNDFKQYQFKVTMSRFTFTSYAKALTELKTYVWGVPLEDLEGFLIKMQTLDDTIVDFTPPLPKRCVQDYHRHFVYQPVEALCYVDGCPRPLRPKDYWTDEKPLPPSPTLLEPWPSNEDDDAEKGNDVKEEGL